MGRRGRPKGHTGAPMSVELTAEVKRRQRKRRMLQERNWKKKNGPVKSYKKDETDE